MPGLLGASGRPGRFYIFEAITCKAILASHLLIQVVLGIGEFRLGAILVMKSHLNPLRKLPLHGEKI